MKIQAILDNIDLGSIALPEFQRGYVWNRPQVKDLMQSLYQRHPVGGLLVWQTPADGAPMRGDGQVQPGTVNLLLDGQQRVTSLYGLFRGKPPRFFDGNAQAFTGLYFQLKDEVFEFYAPLKMKGNPLWIDVTALLQQGMGGFTDVVLADPDLKADAQKYFNRLNAISSIGSIEMHVEQITGEDKTVEVVVDIFNKVNSGGTKLSKGDLALAKICAGWPEARDEMKKRLAKWRKAGFSFKLDWLLRCITTITTGQARFDSLENVTTEQFKEGLERAEKAVDYLLNLISSRLGLDHDRVLGSRYSFPLMARYLSERGFKLAGHQERDKLLFWYIHTFLWGRYAGSVESNLSQDLNHIVEPEGALDRLVTGLRRERGDLRIRPIDFHAWSRGARFYPLLYMLTRVGKARDWDGGIELSKHLLGNLSSLQLHHIFPKARLYDHGYERAEVNALANFTFLTQATNLDISDSNPVEYLEEVEAKTPGVLETHWVPMDRELWRMDRYRNFLKARQERLANAANEFLDSLVKGEMPEREMTMQAGDGASTDLSIATDGIDDEQVLLDLNLWVTEQGLTEGEFYYSPADSADLEAEVIYDVAWPDGVQSGLTQPVAIVLDRSVEAEKLAAKAGFRLFADVDAFCKYVTDDVLREEETA